MKISKKDILNMLLTGCFLGIEIGGGRDTVLNALGEPINISERDRKLNEILYYGILNIYLFNGMVTKYSLDFEYEERNLYGFLLEDLSLEEITSLLKKENISYKRNSLFSHDGFLVIEFKNIKIGFIEDRLVSFWVGWQ